MADQRERAALVALLRSGDLPWSTYVRLVEEAGSASAVIESELEAGRLNLQAEMLGQHDPLAEALDDVQRWEAGGFQLLTVLDDRYPANLRAVHDRPPFLFIDGALSSADEQSVAVVGARKSTQEGEKAAQEISRCLVESNYVVTSGLAAGIDTAVHEAALAAAGRTLGVIGTGLKTSYPPENAALQRRIAREHAVLSPFWPEAGPAKRNFPIRNGVMAGLTLATVIVEASPTSGTRVQARLALGQGRPVLLWRALLEQDWAQLLAETPGTHVVGSAEEVVDVVERVTSLGPLVR